MLLSDSRDGKWSPLPAAVTDLRLFSPSRLISGGSAYLETLPNCALDSLYMALYMAKFMDIVIIMKPLDFFFFQQ